MPGRKILHSYIMIKTLTFCLRDTDYLLVMSLFLFSCTANSQTGVFTLTTGSSTKTGVAFDATVVDQSCILVTSGAHADLDSCIMNKTAGNTSDINASSQYGLNAGVLAKSGAAIIINKGTVTTTATGANGLFATGTNSKVTMQNGIITCSKDGAHGVDATYGGIINLNNVNVTTTGSNASALATDFGGGTVTVNGGIIKTTATGATSHSAGIYSTGIITVTGATVSSAGDCGGVIDGANSINLVKSSLSGALHGIKIWKTAPMQGSATVSLNHSTLNANNGNGFYVSAETGNAAAANITVSNGTTVKASNSTIIKVAGTSTATITCDSVSLSGNMLCSSAGTLSCILKKHTTLTGIIDSANVSIDNTSMWTLTGNSRVKTITDQSGVDLTMHTVSNIIGNGFNVYYNASLSGNAYLASGSFALINGGCLLPYGQNCMTGVQSVLENEADRLLVSPNPATETIHLTGNFDGTRFSTVSVYNTMGKQVYRKNRFDPAHETIDVKQLEAGVYWVVAVQETSRIIKTSFIKL